MLKALLLTVALLSVAQTAAAEDSPRALRQAVRVAMREKEPAARSLALERALTGNDSAAAAAIVLDVVLPAARSERDRAVGVHVLASMEDDEAVQVIVDRVNRARSLSVRISASMALGRSGALDAGPALRALSLDADPRIRAIALSALGDLDGDANLDVIRESLGDPDWRARSAAAWALGKRGNASVVPEMVIALRSAKGRLVDDLGAALARVTGLSVGADAAAYDRWWREQNPEVDAGPPVPWVPPTHDVVAPLTSFRTGGVLFLLSTAKSMEDKVGKQTLDDQTMAAFGVAGQDLLLDALKATTKLDVARVHLRAMIRGVADGVRFDVGTYSDAPNFAFGEPLAADARTRKRAETRVARLSAVGGANLSGSLLRAFDPKARDPLAASDSYDTIVLFSDGHLAWPGETDRTEVVAAVQRWNRVRQIRIIVVAVGRADMAVLGPLAVGPPLGPMLRLH